MEETLVTLTGKFTYVLFHNETNFYTVAKFLINDELEKTITVTGILPDISLDVLYNITGEYTEHPKYGMQFAIQSYHKPLPSEREGIIRYLSSVQFQGIGKKTAEKIVEALGEDCLSMIKENSDILYQIPGLTEKNIASIREGIVQEADGMEELVRFLNVHGIGIRNLVRLNRAYGKEALNKIKENPYRVIEECDGMGFSTADKIAMALGFAKDDERRLYAFLVSLTMDLCMKNGDSFVRLESLEENWHQKTGELNGNFSELLDKAILKRSLVQEENRIYPVSQYEAETEIATFLNDFSEGQSKQIDLKRVHQYLAAMEKDIGIEYDERQKQAMDSFFQNSFQIITGGPGTGKTTVVRAFVNLYRFLYPNASVICAAPTGRAAKRLAELTESEAMTIHSLLKWDLETNAFGKDENEPITADLLIIDEFSMVDAYLFSALLKASENVKKICIIGDEDQLPSVGPGSVLRDLIQSDVFPLVRLNHIYRQKSGSDVISLAHEIRDGEVNFANLSNDVLFFDCSSEQVKGILISVVQTALDKGYKMDDIQVLSPMYAGNAGIDVLNHTLQQQFNPPSSIKREVKFGYTIFREGDKILQLKNQPDDDIYNGDIGILVEIVPAKEAEDHKTTIIVDFLGNYVEFKPESWNNITLAYCISVHKSQGSEYPIVIMPFVKQHMNMLQRKLIYTAVTRAKRSLVLLGDRKVFEAGIVTTDRHPRETSLRDKLVNFSKSYFPF